MGYYSVQIVLEKGRNQLGHMEHYSETIYFGENKRMMKVRFFEAVEKAQANPKATSVVVWEGTAISMHLPIVH